MPRRGGSPSPRHSAPERVARARFPTASPHGALVRAGADAERGSGLEGLRMSSGGHGQAEQRGPPQGPAGAQTRACVLTLERLQGSAGGRPSLPRPTRTPGAPRQLPSPS